MSEAHEKTRIRQLEDAAAHWEHKYANARQYNRNLEERNQRLEAALRWALGCIDPGAGPQFEDVYMKAQHVLAGSVLEPDGNYTDSIDVPPPCDTAETPAALNKCVHGRKRAHCSVCGAWPSESETKAQPLLEESGPDDPEPRY